MEGNIQRETSMPDYKQQFEAQGFVLIPQLFSAAEAAYYRDYYMALHESGADPTREVDLNDPDPLKRYPRMIHMHRWDEVSRDWMIEGRLNDMLTALTGREPFAVQTMLYFKPPQARGQALHQDNYYLRAQPGTCIAAWMALDVCDERNGCLQVVPGSHQWPILCTVPADATQSFTDVTVPVPPECEVRSIIMQPGDVLFFNGSLVHGSLPNVTTDRFRRSLVGHYIEGRASEVYRWYHPVLRMDGSEVKLDEADGGSECGVWVDQAGQAVIEMSGTQVHPGRTE
jgi:phytanoyl-CoA hydroxylase